VLWVIKGLGPGGAERLLCSQAQSEDTTQFSVTCAYVLAWKDHLAEELQRAGVETICLSRRQRDFLWPWRLIAMVRNGSWDIIHIHSPLPGSIARLAARTMPAKKRPVVITTEHNQWSTFHPVTRFLNAVTSRWDAATIAVSNEVRDSLSKHARGRTETLRHGIDLDAVARQRDHRREIRQEFGLTESQFVIGTVANFRPQKDYPNLLGAIRHLRELKVPVTVIAVGQGPDESTIRHLSEKMGLSSQVIFTGFRDDATAILGACDAFVLASQWEGLPVAVMEAAALGLPIVSTAVGGVLEEFAPDTHALLVPPKNPEALARAIAIVATQPERRAALGTAAREVAQRFDVRRSVAHIEDLYARLGGPSSGNGSPAITEKMPVRSPQGVTIRRATPEDREAILDLCRSSLGWGTDPRFEQLFQWKHDLNPFGPSYVWVATDGDQIVGLRAFMRWNFVRGGRVLRAVRAVDTVTHREYQGRGIFTALTMGALQTLHDDNIDFVFNTPNTHSLPGYLKMGWHEVGRVPVALRVVGPRGVVQLRQARQAASHWPVRTLVGLAAANVIDDVIAARNHTETVNSTSRIVSTHMTDDFLRWRYTQEFLDFRVIRSGRGVVLVQFRMRGDSLECLVADSFGVTAQERDRAAVEAARDAEADYVVRTGAPLLSQGFIPAPGFGPLLTWRGVHQEAMPPPANWDVSMGTIALF